MQDLKMRLLASVENHGKMNVDGVYKLYPHETKKNIDHALGELDAEGWVCLRQTQVVDGNKVFIPNVRRSRKQLYTQPQIF